MILGGKDFFERDGAWDGVQRFFVDTYWYIKRKLGHPQELLGTPLSKKNRLEKKKFVFKFCLLLFPKNTLKGHLTIPYQKGHKELPEEATPSED